MKYAIIFGGQSFEHEISIVSAVVMKKVLNAKLSFIFVSSDRKFYEISPDNMKANFFSSKKYEKCPRLSLTHGGFGKHTLFGFKKLEVDCYINLIHGADGEDGKIAGIFEFYSLNFIGPRLEASVLSYNKIFTKKLCELCGVQTLPYEVLKRNDEIKNLSFPVILKPARLGSSIGVQVARNSAELDYAKDVAFEFDDEVLVEPFMQDIQEFNLAGFRANDKFYFSQIEEPRKKDFLDFEQKYLAFSSQSANIANLDENTKTAVQEAFIKIYENGHFDSALIRCDFFLYENKVYLNEINPNPGSLANYLFKDFTSSLNLLANSLPKKKEIKVEYNFISQISGQKGKIS